MQVVEAELQRIPRALLRGHSQELWSIVYMPQASAAAVAAQRSLRLHGAPHGRLEHAAATCGPAWAL